MDFIQFIFIGSAANGRSVVEEYGLATGPDATAGANLPGVCLLKRHGSVVAAAVVVVVKEELAADDRRAAQ